MDDPYYAAVHEQWPNIRMCYLQFADKHPVMLFDVDEQRIYAYPYEAFKADLNERSQRMLEEQYQQALVAQKIVVFVRDNVKRKFVSYAVDDANMGFQQPVPSAGRQIRKRPKRRKRPPGPDA
jgi:hypothetical protein